MNNERLEHLIDVMQRVIDYKLPFDMEQWCKNDSKPYDCGTAACMAGWACRDELFNKQGLSFGEGGGPVYQGSWGFSALSKFFGITYGEGDHLFDGDWLNDPKAAIERIREVMEGKW